jgi:hypothetical protein
MREKILTRSLQFMTGMVVRPKRPPVGIKVIFSSCFVGDAVAKFSEVNIHKRLVSRDRKGILRETVRGSAEECFFGHG